MTESKYVNAFEAIDAVLTKLGYVNNKAGESMSKPKRIQRKRTKGWKMPENAVYVGRPSKWGNPFTKDDNPLGNTNLGMIDHDFGDDWRKQVVFCFAWMFGYLPEDEQGDFSHYLNPSQSIKSRSAFNICLNCL